MKLRYRALSAVLALSMALSGSPIQALANELGGGVTPSDVPSLVETDTSSSADEGAASSGQEGAAEEPAANENSAADTSEPATEKATDAAEDSAVEPEAAPAAMNRSAAAIEPVVEAELTANGNTLVDLGDPSTTVQLNRGQAMNLRIHAVFPVATEKRIDITLKPGVRYRDDAFNLDKTQGWVQELKENGQTIPSKQADSSKKPTFIYGANMNDGVLSYEFQDTTQEVTFMVPIQLQSNLDGALTVPEGVTVEQSYVDEAGAQANEKLTTTTSLKNPRVLNVIGRNDVWNKVNAQGNIEVGFDDPRGTTETVKWIASTNDRSQIVVDDYFFALLVPAKAEYLGLYVKQGETDVSDADLTTLKAGEQFTKSDGSTYTVPEDKTLYVWRKENKLVTFENGDNAFNPMWRFPAANFPAGTIATIEQIDVGVKLHNPYGESSYLPYDAKKLSSVNYEIVEPTEDVYVNTQMYRPSREADWPLWEGYIADNNVYMGAPGFEHTQERTLGYFTVGNRGTGNSRAKTIIIDYDVNNTGVGGVTAQALPFLSRDYAGAEATKVTDFKVTLWDSNTNATTTYPYDNPPQRFRVQTVLGDGAHEGVYLKHIEYKIDTIPAKTSFISYRSGTGANDGSGKEDFNQPDATLPYFGVVRNNTVIEKGKWGDDPTLFKTRIRIENTGDEEPEFNNRNQDVWDWDGDGVAENNKYAGRSKDHVTIGDTFTGFTGKSYIEGHNSGNYVWHDGLIDPVIGEQQADRTFSYFEPTWNGSSTGAQTLNAIYVISPFGSDMSFKLYSRAVGAKQAWMENKYGIEYSPQPDVYEVAPSDTLKEAYPKARVYKLDLTKITNQKDKYTMRTGGAQFYWYEAAKAIPYTTNVGYWAYDGDIALKISYTSDPAKDEARYVGPPGGLASGWKADEGIVWYEFDTDTKEELVHGGGMTTDRWDLNGNGSTDDLFGRPVGAIEPKSPTDVVVQSAAKMATQPDSRYVTYDGQKRTEIGAESTVDYRLIATNPTQTAANGLTIYWPVPKEGQNWGQSVQPTKKAFEFTMNLNGGIKSELPAGYTVSYARDAEPTSQALKWDGFDWTDEADTASWTAEDWARVNFVRISSPDDAQIQPKEAQTFLFNMRVGDVAPEVAEKNPLDVMAPAYLRDLGSGKGYRFGQPVAMVIEPGVITGKVWYDIDNDSIIDKDDQGEDLEQAIPDAVVELRDERGDLVETVRTGEDGTYKFQGLIPGDRDPLGKKYTVTVYNPAPPKTDQGEGASNPYTRFSPVTEKGDVKLTGTADAQKAVSEPVTASLAGNVVLNAGLSRPRAVQVEKIWDENNGAGDQTATTVSEVSVKLLANGKAAKDIDGKAVGNLTLNAAGTWKGVFENLPINDAATNQAIEYTVEEASVPTGYKATVTGSDSAGYKITNKRSKVTVKVTKEWSDAENQDGKRPDSVTVQLKANGTDVAGKTLTLNAGNSWKGEFAGLLTHDDKGEIAYTVAETGVPAGYKAEITGSLTDGFTITNTHVPEKVTVSGTKTWADADNQDGKRPESITVKLLADGKETGKEATVKADADGAWKYSFSGLDKYKAGKEIAYSVDEAAVPEGYEKSVDGYNITNTHQPAKTSVSVEKVWAGIDADAAPAVKVDLLADGKAVDTVTLDGNAEGGSWKHTFSDLDQYKAGKKITYTVAEQGVSDGKLAAGGHDYKVKVAQDGDSWTVTNTLVNPKTEVSGRKVWADADNQDGIRPDSVTVSLLENGVATGKTAVVPADGDGSFAFSDLPTFDSKGAKIAYSVDEVAVPKGYEKSVEGTTITNTHTPAVRTVTVTKAWDDHDDLNGVRPDSVTVALLADGEDTGKSVELSAANEWAGAFENLPVNKAGKEIEYAVSEEQATGYEEPVVTGDVATGFTVTNKRVPEFTLTYEVAGDPEYGYPADSVTPDPVTGIKYGSDVDLVDPLTTDESVANPGAAPAVANRSADAAATDEGTGPIHGTWYFYGWFAEPDGTEAIDAVRNITADVTVYGRWEFIPSRSVSVTKVWDDADDKDGIRPDKVTVRLIADGEETDKTLELTADSGWTGSFTELTRRGDNGDDIVYTVAEEAVEGYESSVEGDMEAGFTVTNTHEPKPDEPKPEPGKPSKPKGKKPLPKTGDPAMIAVASAATGLMALAGALRRRRRR